MAPPQERRRRDNGGGEWRQTLREQYVAAGEELLGMLSGSGGGDDGIVPRRSPSVSLSPSPSASVGRLLRWREPVDENTLGCTGSSRR